MGSSDDERLQWEALDPLVLSGAKLQFLMKVQELTGCSLPEAQDLLRSRYDLLRRERPNDFAQSHDDYWDGFYS